MKKPQVKPLPPKAPVDEIEKAKALIGVEGKTHTGMLHPAGMDVTHGPGSEGTRDAVIVTDDNDAVKQIGDAMKEAHPSPIVEEEIDWKARFEQLEAQIIAAAQGTAPAAARDIVDPETGIPYARQRATNERPASVYKTVKGNTRSDF